MTNSPNEVVTSLKQDQTSLKQDQISLLPCPFCGGEAISRGSDYEGYWVTCKGCMAFPYKKNTREQAIEAWNTRHGELEAHQNGMWAQTLTPELMDYLAERIADEVEKRLSAKTITKTCDVWQPWSECY